MAGYEDPSRVRMLAVGHGFRYTDGTEKKIYIPIYSIAFALANWFAPKNSKISRTTGRVLIYFK